MVVATMARLSAGATKNISARNLFFNKSSPATLGILAFETARTMSRLVAIYRSLTDDETIKLRKEIMRSKGVTYLNSQDEGFLLNLAGAERLEDLHHAAITVSRLGQKCSEFGLNPRFDHVYTDLKLGIIDVSKFEFDSKSVQKIVHRMEKYSTATADLYAALECLAEMELSERKVQRWMNNLGPTQLSNTDYLKEKIAFQKRQVQHYKEISLWNQSFDKSVENMSRIVCVIFARICSVFGPYISGLPCVPKNLRHTSNLNNQQRRHLEEEYFCLVELRDYNKRNSTSAPIPNTSKKGRVRFPSRETNPFFPDHIDFGIEFTDNMVCSGSIGKNNRVLRLAPPSTVGGSGLSLRYANVIICAERCLSEPGTIDEEVRETLYEMLPANLKATVRAKLKRQWLKKEEKSEEYSLAEGWRNALEEIMGWLGPMAHDTVTWLSERNMEKKKFDPRPRVLLLQTLHYSDLEKTEASIAEVLVGLSCIYRYENRRSPARAVPPHR